MITISIGHHLLSFIHGIGVVAVATAVPVSATATVWATSWSAWRGRASGSMVTVTAVTISAWSAFVTQCLCWVTVSRCTHWAILGTACGGTMVATLSLSLVQAQTTSGQGSLPLLVGTAMQ